MKFMVASNRWSKLEEDLHRVHYDFVVSLFDAHSASDVINNFSTRSSACLPIIQEICWLAAVFDVELVIEWIDTHSNVFPDLLSRRYDDSFDQEEWDRLFALHAPSPEEVKYWTEQWPPQNPARPELRPHVPVADVRQYSTVWASLSAAELGAILPAYLQ